MDDWYFKQLSGQWVDITGVREGDYIVRVKINAAHTFSEGANRYRNTGARAGPETQSNHR